MQTKYKLPDDVKLTVISYIKGYNRRLGKYNDKRFDIIYATPQSFAEYKVDGETHRQYFPHGSTTGNPTENKALALDSLEEIPDVKKLRAVEQAKLHIGNDILSEEVRQKLKTAIWFNCLSGKDCPYEVHDLPTIGRNQFYEYKAKFLYEIALHDGLI